jgi:prolipoprotein diacylglyceryltransferase
VYESALSALFFGIVWFLQRKIKVAGILFFIAIGLNGVARFFIEKIRVNNTYDFGNVHITQAEIISTFLVLLGISGTIILYKRAVLKYRN